MAAEQARIPNMRHRPADREGKGKLRRAVLETERKLYSQGNEELIIRDFFKDRPGGTFLDVGAGHPIKHSTTYYLETHLGWSGICVDALPDYGPVYAEQRLRARFRNFIVSDHSGTIESFYHVKAAPGLSSTEPERIWDGKKLNARRIQVPTITLDDLLESERVVKIDFLSIDIEGSASKALSGLSISRFRPDLVCIEPDGRTKERLALTLAHFLRNRYVRIERYLDHDRVNWYFRPAQ